MNNHFCKKNAKILPFLHFSPKENIKGHMYHQTAHLRGSSWTVPQGTWPACNLTRLADRFDNQIIIYRKQALQDWNQLRFADFPSSMEYTRALLRITRMMRLVGYDNLVTEEQTISKTLSRGIPAKKDSSTFFPNYTRLGRSNHITNCRLG